MTSLCNTSCRRVQNVSLHPQQVMTLLEPKKTSDNWQKIGPSDEFNKLNRFLMQQVADF